MPESASHQSSQIIAPPIHPSDTSAHSARVSQSLRDSHARPATGAQPNLAHLSLVLHILTAQCATRSTPRHYRNGCTSHPSHQPCTSFMAHRTSRRTSSFGVLSGSSGHHIQTCTLPDQARGPLGSITPASALSVLREMLQSLNVKRATFQGTHEFRRGHARDM